MNLNEIDNPSFVKELNIKQLRELAEEIRTFLIDSISKTGGHLSSNLGIIELTIALCYVFDANKDKFLFDVGHQSYVYKILTGRAKDFPTLRKYQGLSGFQKRKESKYDVFEAGHSSTSLGTALGMAIARDLDHQDYEVLPIIGDGALLSGTSFEALNNIGFEKNKIIIIFNDNNMSISTNVGGASNTINQLRTSKTYNNFKEVVSDILEKSEYSKSLLEILRTIRNTLKKKMVNSGFFDDFNLDYLGPVDGHDFKDLIRNLEIAKNKKGPVVVHIITKKGKGYEYAEKDKEGLWHGVGPFDPSSGQFLEKKKEGYCSYSGIVANTLGKMMKQDQDIVTITPAMITGSALNKLFEVYKDRTFDCGIAEEHAMLLASGLALSGKRPFVSIYSSFLQRAYDQINHDICRMKLPVVIGIDRAGLVGADGETHHGIFDISILSPLPNMTIAQGKDAKETSNLIYSAFKYASPTAIRYPKQEAMVPDYCFEYIEKGSWTYEQKDEDPKASIISYGPDVELIKDRYQNVNVINARFIKPLDEEVLNAISEKPIIVYTKDMETGGLGSLIAQYYIDKGIKANIEIIGIKDHYVTHGDLKNLFALERIDLDSLDLIVNKYL